MFVFDIASHERVVPLWCAARRTPNAASSHHSSRTPEARALRVADAVVELMRVGVLRSGDKLPSERLLAAMLDISRDAVRVALDMLQQRRMLKKRHGTRSELCSSGLPAQEPPSLAAACRELVAVIAALPAVDRETTGARADDLIRLAMLRARETDDAEAMATCAQLEAAHDLRRLVAE